MADKEYLISIREFTEPLKIKACDFIILVVLYMCSCPLRQGVTITSRQVETSFSESLYN